MIDTVATIGLVLAVVAVGVNIALVAVYVSESWAVRRAVRADEELIERLRLGQELTVDDMDDGLMALVLALWVDEAERPPRRRPWPRPPE